MPVIRANLRFERQSHAGVLCVVCRIREHDCKCHGSKMHPDIMPGHMLWQYTAKFCVSSVLVDSVRKCVASAGEVQDPGSSLCYEYTSVPVAICIYTDVRPAE